MSLLAPPYRIHVHDDDQQTGFILCGHMCILAVKLTDTFKCTTQNTQLYLKPSQQDVKCGTEGEQQSKTPPLSWRFISCWSSSLIWRFTRCTFNFRHYKIHFISEHTLGLASKYFPHLQKLSCILPLLSSSAFSFLFCRVCQTTLFSYNATNWYGVWTRINLHCVNKSIGLGWIINLKKTNVSNHLHHISSPDILKQIQ